MQCLRALKYRMSDSEITKPVYENRLDKVADQTQCEKLSTVSRGVL